MMGNRRDLLKTMALLPLAACTSNLNKDEASSVQQPAYIPAGWKPPGAELMLQKVKIKKVRAITTAPYGTGLVIVKVEIAEGVHEFSNFEIANLGNHAGKQ